MPRLSNGIYLEVLTSRPQAGVNLEVTVWDGANPANMLAELQGAADVTFQHILSDVGSGSFRIARDDPKATTANIREGNLVKIRLSAVDVFPYFIEAPKLVVNESGRSHWELAGPGALSYLTQAVVYPPGWPTPTGTDRVWTASTAGTILGTLVDEAQLRGALSHITYDFTTTVDSHGAVWPVDLTLTTHAGTSVLDVAKQLSALGYDIQITPGLVFQAFAPGLFGRHLESTVIWRYGHHIAGEVTKVGIRSALQNVELVEGADGNFLVTTDPVSISDPYTGRREGGLSFTSSADPTMLANAGNAQMALTAADANALSIPLVHGTAAGNYTPYTDYVPGDWIKLDVPGQYNLQTFQLRGLTLSQTAGGDYTTTADLNAVALDYLVRLRNMITKGTGTGSAAGGSVAAYLSGGKPSPATSFGASGDIGVETFGATAVAGNTGTVADAGHIHPMPSSPAGQPLGLTGATAATRYVGATTSGAPGSGTFATGDFIIDRSGSAWVCTSGGSPGSWTQLAAAPPGGAAPARIASAVVATAAVVCTFGSAPAQTSLLFALCAGVATATTVVSIVQTNVTWSKLRSKINGTGANVELWKGVPSGTPGTVVTTTFSGATNNAVSVAEWATGHGLAGTVDQAADATGTSAYQQTGWIVPTALGALVFLVFADNNGTILLQGPTGPFYLLTATSFMAFAYGWTGKHPVQSSIPTQTSSVWANMVVSVI